MVHTNKSHTNHQKQKCTKLKTKLWMIWIFNTAVISTTVIHFNLPKRRNAFEYLVQSAVHCVSKLKPAVTVTCQIPCPGPCCHKKLNIIPSPRICHVLCVCAAPQKPQLSICNHSDHITLFSGDQKQDWSQSKVFKPTKICVGIAWSFDIQGSWLHGFVTPYCYLISS